jgi:hypothetical protein
VPTWAKYFGAVLVVLAVYGVFVGVFWGGFGYAWQLGRDGGWSWWHYALAVPALGAVAALCELFPPAFLAPYSWRGEDHPIWKRGVRVLLIMAILGAGIALAFSPIWLAKLG